MSSLFKPCSCGYSPCVCPSPAGFGCAADSCVPRPRFFNGQLITDDDLNAVMTYFRTKEAMLARLVGGWGILGGLRVDAAPGVPKAPLSNAPPSLVQNPQILAGTAIQILPGAAIDANGRTLAVCSPRVLDAAALVAEAPSVPQTAMCNAWFAPQTIPGCSNADDKSFELTATSYWLVAEYVEAPARPVPRFSGGGPCDPAPTCDFSRRVEDVRFRLVASLPASYFLLGCLDALPLPPELLGGLVPVPPSPGVEGPGLSGTLFKGGSPWMPSGSPGFVDPCVFNTYALFDVLNGLAAQACCTHPAVVLARVLVTSRPGSLGKTLPEAPVYLILQDGYPFRRVILSAALHTFFTAGLACRGGNG